MLLILSIDVFVAGLLIATATTRGLERTLPLATALLILFPVESQITVPGLFDLTTQRVIVLTLLGLYFATGSRGGAKLTSDHLPLVILLSLQFLWLATSTAHSVVFTISLKTLLSQILDYFVVFYIFVKTIRSVSTIHNILAGFVTAMIFLSFFGAIEAYTGWGLLSLFPEVAHRFSIEGYGGPDGSGRVQTTFSHPILFGGGLAMAIPLALYLSSIATRLHQKWFLWAGILVMFLCIYKTGSRGPWIALVISLALLAVAGGRQIRQYLMIITLLTTTVLVARPGVWLTLDNLYGATRDPDSPEGESYQWRFALYDLAFRELGKDSERALWGYGPESFYYLQLTTDFSVDGVLRTVKVESCDSSVAALMIETGYGGLLVTALVLITPALIAFASFRREKEPDRQLHLLLLCNMIAYYFLMTNVAIYGWGQQSYFLWIILAISVAYPALRQSAPDMSHNLLMLGATPGSTCLQTTSALNNSQ